MVSRTLLASACLGAALWGATDAHTQAVVLRPSADGSAKAEAEHARGTYTGVKAGGNEAPAIAAKAGTTPAAVTWPGFQMQADGSSRVFLQTTAPLDISSARAGGKFVVGLGNARVVGDTNRLPLYTQFFNTPVTRVEIKRTSGQTELQLTLRAPVEPRVTSAEAQSGFHFVYIDFPPGDYLAHAPPVSMAKAGLPQGEASAPESVPDQLEGEVDASGGIRANVSADAELPPGMAKPKAKAKASGKVKFGL